MKIETFDIDYEGIEKQMLEFLERKDIKIIAITEPKPLLFRIIWDIK